MEEGRKSQSRLQGEGDLTMSIHSIQHDYLDFRLKKAEEAKREQFCVEMMKRLCYFYYKTVNFHEQKHKTISTNLESNSVLGSEFNNNVT